MAKSLVRGLYRIEGHAVERRPNRGREAVGKLAFGSRDSLLRPPAATAGGR